MGSPGMGSPGTGSPGMGSPSAGSPGMGSAGLGTPGTGSPGMGAPAWGARARGVCLPALGVPRSGGHRPRPGQALPLGWADASNLLLQPGWASGRQCWLSCRVRVSGGSRQARSRAKAALANGAQEAEKEKTDFYLYTREGIALRFDITQMEVTSCAQLK